METITVNQLIEQLGLEIVSGSAGLERMVKTGYCGDLLSDVMGHAPHGCVWLTVQAHQNIVAVAVLREMAAIIVTGGNQPDPETMEKAEQEGVPLLSWPGSSYTLAGKLFGLGIDAS